MMCQDSARGNAVTAASPRTCDERDGRSSWRCDVPGPWNSSDLRYPATTRLEQSVLPKIPSWSHPRLEKDRQPHHPPVQFRPPRSGFKSPRRPDDPREETSRSSLALPKIDPAPGKHTTRVMPCFSLTMAGFPVPKIDEHQGQPLKHTHTTGQARPLPKSPPAPPLSSGVSSRAWSRQFQRTTAGIQHMDKVSHGGRHGTMLPSFPPESRATSRRSQNPHTCLVTPRHGLDNSHDTSRNNDSYAKYSSTCAVGTIDIRIHRTHLAEHHDRFKSHLHTLAKARHSRAEKYYCASDWLEDDGPGPES